MRTLLNPTGWNNSSQTSEQDRNIGTDIETTNIKKLIRQANSVDIRSVFAQYDLKLDRFEKKICCPLPHHNDRSPSFWYYIDTNSFYCFGCGAGGGSTEFEALMKNISKEQAAKHILNMFDTDIVSVGFIDKSGSEFVQKQKQYLKFADLVSGFLAANKEEQALEYAEKITLVFDTLNGRNIISIDGLSVLIDKLEDSFRKYK